MEKRGMYMPAATAYIRGSSSYPALHGTVTFQRVRQGVLVTAEVYGLPDQKKDGSGFFAFHIHNGNSCSGTDKDPFADAGVHYNPEDKPHPYHAGDLPPLLSNNGFAYMKVLTNRFKISDIINRVIIVHESPDDFTSQPAGNAGSKIGCGKIIMSS